MGRHATVLCAVVLLGGASPALGEDGSGFSVGLQASYAKTAMDIDLGYRDSVGGTMTFPDIDKAHVRDSAMAFRLGYCFAFGNSMGLDAHLTMGAADSHFTVRQSAESMGIEYEGFESLGNEDPAFAVGVDLALRGKLGGLSYTGRVAYGSHSFEQETSSVSDPGPPPYEESDELSGDVSSLAVEVTLGAEIMENTRVFGGLGYLSRELDMTIRYDEDDDGSLSWSETSIEGSADSAFLLFLGLEVRTEKTSAFARFGILGEEVGSASAGVSLIF